MSLMLMYNTPNNTKVSKKDVKFRIAVQLHVTLQEPFVEGVAQFDCCICFFFFRLTTASVSTTSDRITLAKVAELDLLTFVDDVERSVESRGRRRHSSSLGDSADST